MDYLKAFIIGGSLCLLAQILIDKTKLTPARILVGYVVAGVILGGIGIYKPIAEFTLMSDLKPDAPTPRTRRRPTHAGARGDRPYGPRLYKRP